MIKTIISSLFIILALTIGLGIYLQPDDLRGCSTGPDSDNSKCQVVGAIVAISGGDTNARTNEAIALYKKGWSDKIIFSGAALDKDSPSNAKVMRDTALAAGVPASSIAIDELAETTKQNAQNIKPMVSDLRIKSIILVTSGYHQRRASLEFSKYVDNMQIINHSASNDSNWSSLWWLSFNGWYLAITELFKIISFFVVGTR